MVMKGKKTSVPSSGPGAGLLQRGQGVRLTSCLIRFLKRSVLFYRYQSTGQSIQTIQSDWTKQQSHRKFFFFLSGGTTGGKLFLDRV